MSKISHNLQSAISNLEIKNIFINSSVAQHLGGDPLLSDYEEASINLKHRVKKSVVLSDAEDKARLVRIYIDFGVEWKENQTHELLSNIDVEYVLEYSLKKDLPQECIDEFALKNSTIHVWPYWREYLGNICERLNLPRIMLPTMQLKHHSRESDK